jgi:hypothetical protein
MAIYTKAASTSYLLYLKNNTFLFPLCRIGHQVLA